MSMTTQNETGNVTSFLSTIIGGIVAVIGGLTATEMAAVIGALVAVGGFFVNLWAIVRRDRRETRLLNEQLRERDTDEAA